MNNKITEAVSKIRDVEPLLHKSLEIFNIEIVNHQSTASTSGKVIIITEQMVHELSTDELAIVLIHELLHHVLNQPMRIGHKDPLVYNYATDIIVNEIISMYTLKNDKLPLVTKQIIKMTDISDESVESIYERLMPMRHRLYKPQDITIEEMGRYNEIECISINDFIKNLLVQNPTMISNPALMSRLQNLGYI